MQKNGIYNVMTQKKDVNLNIRIRADVRDEFKVVADLRGASVSTLIHQFMVKTIREEKEREPQAFNIEKQSDFILVDDLGQVGAGLLKAVEKKFLHVYSRS